jgi:hypothetical protein
MEHGIPRNPFINAGAIVVSDVLLAGHQPREVGAQVGTTHWLVYPNDGTRFAVLERIGDTDSYNLETPLPTSATSVSTHATRSRAHVASACAPAVLAV